MGAGRGAERTWGRRLAWLVGLWLAGVAVLGAVAMALRYIMRLAGLSS